MMRTVPAVLLAAMLLASAAMAQESSIRTDRFVPHESTVPANAGTRVGLFLRERLSVATAAAIAGGQAPDGRVVLFIHGVSVPSIPDFDLDFGDYSWMAYLAANGFDTFAMDHTGYGFSPRPAMTNPCNLVPAERAVLDPAVLPEPCTADRATLLTSSQTDWDEIDTVVDYIRALRGVERVSLIGWSLGGLRAGGYAARFPEKVDRLVLFAPFYQPESPAAPPMPYPAAGAPLSLQTEQALMQDRWAANLACENQVEPGVRERVWQTIMAFDDLGSVWAPPRGVMRVRSASYWGWNTAAAARIRAPTLILVGLEDGLLPGAEALYRDLAGTEDKLLVRMECATHFAVWEASQYRLLHEASREWLTEGSWRGRREGEFRVGYGGVDVD